MTGNVDWSEGEKHIAERHPELSVEIANEALTDIDAVTIEPDYNSESGTSVRTIGFSTTAGCLISVITYEQDGAIYGATAFRSRRKDTRIYEEANE